jgi:hypothetical protein
MISLPTEKMPEKARLHLLLLLLSVAFAIGACGIMGSGGIEPRPNMTPAPTTTPGGPATISFREDISPLLRRGCAMCHGGQVGLYVDSYDTLMAGSSRGKVIVPGDPEESVLLQRLRGEVQPRMPLNRPSMSEEEIAVIETWILEGAPNN